MSRDDYTTWQDLVLRARTIGNTLRKVREYITGGVYEMPPEGSVMTDQQKAVCEALTRELNTEIAKELADKPKRERRADPKQVRAVAFDKPFVEFADLSGTYDEVCSIVQPLLGTGYMVREDGFTRDDKEVHRVYLTDKAMYEHLKALDTFSKHDQQAEDQSEQISVTPAAA